MAPGTSTNKFGLGYYGCSKGSYKCNWNKIHVISIHASNCLISELKLKKG